VRAERLILVFLAAAGGCFAGITAYLISYEEYRRHFPDKSRPRKMALEAALFAFAFFFGLGVILAVVLPAGH
jgi:hypothetical protein